MTSMTSMTIDTKFLGTLAVSSVILVFLIARSSNTAARYLHHLRILLIQHRCRRKRPKVVYQKPVRRTQDVRNSGKLQQLPPEVRLQIFRHAIGDRLLHLVESDANIRRVLCHADDDAVSWYHPCWKRGVHKGDPLLPLLLSCRHIYSEAIEILYSKNTFHFLRPSDLVSFVDSIPRFQASLLRSIKLYVNPTSTGTDMAYVAIWPILSSLPTLQKLRLLIAPSVMTKEVWKLHEAQLLEPIRTFEQPLKVFDLFLSVFPEWIDGGYQNSCHVRPIKEMRQLQGAHLSRYS